VVEDCGLIATDRLVALRHAGRADPLRDLSGNGPVGLRLGPWLAAQLPDQRARRSMVRLLVGSARIPRGGLLYQFASIRPQWVPAPIRASWAADAIDLDGHKRSGRDRKWARCQARHAVLTGALTSDSAAGRDLPPAV
jgi:hypothetical protein